MTAIDSPQLQKLYGGHYSADVRTKSLPTPQRVMPSGAYSTVAASTGTRLSANTSNQYRVSVPIESPLRQKLPPFGLVSDPKIPITIPTPDVDRTYYFLLDTGADLDLPN